MANDSVDLVRAGYGTSHYCIGNVLLNLIIQSTFLGIGVSCGMLLVVSGVFESQVTIMKGTIFQLDQTLISFIVY